MASTVIVSKAKAAFESFVRTFFQSFVPALALVNFTTTDVSGAKSAVLAAAASAASAAIASVARLFIPIQTDSQTVGVAGVSAPGSGFTS